MTQDTEQEMGPGGRGRGRKALPVDPLGDVHAVYGMDGGEEDIIDAEIVDELYWSAVSRPPTPEELQGTIQHLQNAGDGRRQALEDILWGLLNSNEFLLRR